jgi:L-asparaginase/Glu-tRNA(Gln) amidotransferase subunit D
MTFNYVDPSLEIAVINSSDSIDLVQSCSESDALILNIKDSDHLSESLNQQLKILTDVGIPSILVNQLNGDLVIPSYKMNTETAYAKLAVIMSKLEDKKLIEPVFAKNISNEFL